MNFSGILLGLATLLIIGAGFVWVIRCEYHLGYLWWPYVMGTGFLAIGSSLFVSSAMGSALMGIFGAALVWGSTELRDQAVRAEIGWFPFNPGKKPDPPLVETIRSWRAPQL